MLRVRSWGLIVEGRTWLGVAEGRKCGMGRRRIVQLVEVHAHFERGIDSIFGSWSRLYYVVISYSAKFSRH